MLQNAMLFNLLLVILLSRNEIWEQLSHILASSTWREILFNSSECPEKNKERELVDGDGSVKVGYADKWLETRQDVSRML